MTPPPDDPDPVATLVRVAKAFLIPFLFSFALALVGSRLDVAWLHYLGLGGVGLTTVGLLLWLVR